MSWSGTSRPPNLWHDTPGVRLMPGNEIWWTEARDWPEYEVRNGTFIELADQYHDIVRVLAGRRHTEVAASRIFVSRELAEAEAQVLHEFAIRHTPVTNTRRIEPSHRRRVPDG